ncbi:phenylalanine--tRNA ligase subunit beta [Polymorphobacter sp.]|uniref:phenylalanine--tRNA ligase subunit beta n=1 Tax=Polymorphobacter sp. TaxID=1909290 RepID=UPI003F6F78AB
MKFPLSWLKAHLETDADLAAITDGLTRLGLEVEGVEDASVALAPFVIAEVLSAAPHPQADKLQVLSVDAGPMMGNGGPVQVVCGAPNARAGLKGVFGPPGAFVPGAGITLKVASIRGVESSGMMCSARELELSDAHEGIIELPADAPVGTAYADWAGLADPVIDVAITPNRQDCMGVHGIARDLAALGLGRLVEPDTSPVPGRFPCPVDIATEDSAGCPAFLGRVVRGVANGASPEWMQRWLVSVGLRPISALVDITNYMTMAFGRPLHVYDVATLSGGLVARRARAGETIEALNGKHYTLDETMTVIADARAVHDIGGIMGGMESGVSPATTYVLIEAAFFAPERIGATGRALGITSDARARFERGVDPGFVAPGLELATWLVLEICGGEPSEVVTAGSLPLAPRHVRYHPARVAALAGIAIDEDIQADILTRLGFGVSRAADVWTVTVPSWRRDIGQIGATESEEGEADIVEEVVRLFGLDAVKAVALPRAEGVARPTATPAQKQARRLRRVLAARGADEAITWSFLPPAQAEAFGGAAHILSNPISADLAHMRPSLLPGLLAAAARNFDRGQASVRLFELGQRYLASGEHPSAALLLAGEARPRDWRHGAATRFEAHDAKAEALAALAALGVPVDRLAVAAPADRWWHPGRAGRLTLGKAVLADFGLLHPATVAGFDVKGPVAAVELYLDALPPMKGRKTAPYAPPALLPLSRDFAFLVDATLPADSLVRAVAGADKALIAGVRLFDRFDGAGVPEGKLSLAVEVTLQPGDKTLTDADIEAVSARIIAAVAKVGGVLRG